MQQQDLLLAGDPASIERARARTLRRNLAASDKIVRGEPSGEVVDLGSKLNGKPQLPPAGIHHGAAAEQILRTFNTWAFKREQPSDIGLMLRVISLAIASAQPLSFVLYWGKGPRCGLADPDLRCLDFLRSLSDRVNQGYAPGAVIKLIFTDTHAGLNGHSPEGTRNYFGDVEVAARDRGFTSRFLSDLVRAAQILRTDPNQEPIEATTLLKLIASARKWYRGSGTPADGARTYYCMNIMERRAIEAVFPDSIFITFNGSDLRALFPEHMPIFYMYSLRRGFSVKPWFLPLDARPCTTMSCTCAETSRVDGVSGTVCSYESVTAEADLIQRSS